LLPPPLPLAGLGAGLVFAGAERTGADRGVETRDVAPALVALEEGTPAAANALAARARAWETLACCAFLSFNATNLCRFSLTAACCNDRARSSFFEIVGAATAAGVLDSVWRPSLNAKWKANPAAMKSRITHTCWVSRSVMVA
jgi:hypothetical protein